MDTHVDQRFTEIRGLLKDNPRGMSISEISDRLGMRRTIVSRDLKYLHRLGQVEMQSIGTSKVYFFTAKIPVAGILNYSSEMILILDEDHEIIELNEPLLRTVGKNREDLKGKRITDCDEPLFVPLRSLNYNTESVEIIPIRLHISDDPGVERHFEVKHVPIVFEDTTKGSILYVEDITEQIRYRDALRLSEAQYKAIVEDQNDSIFRYLPDGTLTFTNRAFQKILGRWEDFRGGKIDTVLSAEHWQAFRSATAGLTAECPQATVNTQIETREGTRDYSFLIRAIFNPDGSTAAFQGIGRDITSELSAQRLKDIQTKNLEFLYWKSQLFLETLTSKEIFQLISAGIAELIPGAVAMTFSYDAARNLLTFRSLMNEKMEDILKYLPGNPDYSFQIPHTLFQEKGELSYLSKGKLYLLENDEYKPLVGEEVVNCLTNLIGQRSVYATMMVWEGSLVGAVAIAVPSDSVIANQILVETFIQMGALALQRHLAFESLRKSDDRFRLIAETAPLPISIVGEDGKYLFINAKFVETFGYTKEDIPDGRRWFIRMFPDADEMNRARALWREDFKDSKPGEIRMRQFQVRCKDGSFKSIIFRPVTLIDGSQLIVYEDVTELEEAGRVRNLLAEIVRSSHDGVIGMTRGGRIQTWNPGAERIYGYTAEEAIGKDISLIIPESRLHEKYSLLARTEQGEYISDFETQRISKDSRLIDVSVTISPIFDTNHQIIGTSTIFRDISARKAHERLQELEAFYREMVDSINVGVYRSTGDPEGRFVWGNSSLVRILGYSSFESVREVPVTDLFLHAHGREDLIAELREHGFVRNRELLLKRADGAVANVLVTALATFNDKGEICFINGIVEDITQQRILAHRLAMLENPG